MRKLYFYSGVILLLLVFFNNNFLYSQNKIITFPYSESFETGLGDWVQSTDDNFDWTRQTGGTPSAGTGPNSAYADSYYIYTEASSNFNNSTYLDASFDFTQISKPILSFYYHMFGNTMGSLHIDVWDGIWNEDVSVITGQQQDNHSDSWKLKQVDLTNFVDLDSVVIRLRGITGDSYTSDICVDYIEVIEGNDMTIDTVLFAQPISDSIFIDTDNNLIGLIQISTKGVINPITVNDLFLSKSETDNFSKDIENVKIYYTENDSSFKKTDLVTSTNDLNTPLTLNKELKPGNNYFWIAYDISNLATINNYVDVMADSLSIDAMTEKYIINNGFHDNKSKIVEKPQYWNFMPANIVVGQPDFFTQNTTLDEFTGSGSNNSAISSKGVLAVGSQSYYRIMLWNEIPDSNGTPADIVLGNPDFNTIENGPTASYMRNVEGVCFSPDGEKLITSDGNNNRVLIWNNIPDSSATPADVVIGQTDFTTSTSGIGPDKLYYPGGVIVTPNGKLLINDLYNNRVLIFNQIPTTNGASADVVIGQDDFYSNLSGMGPNKLNGPWYSSVSPEGKLIIADRMNNRILIFNEIPTKNGVSADIVIGQDDFYSNSSGLSETKMYIPIGVTVSPHGELAVGEFNNNRVLIYNEIPTTNGAPADIVLGQPDFYSNTAFNGGINEKSMYHPYGINFDLNGRLFVNGRDMHRVMIYGELPQDTADLEISISADKSNPHIGETITYTFTLTNHGPNTTSDIVVKSSLPALFKLNNYSTDKGEYLPYGGTWNIPFMASGESINLLLEGTVDDGGGNIDAYSNIVASAAIDTNMNNNATSLSINVVNEAPTIAAFDNDTIVQGTTTGWIPFTISDTDSEMSKLEVTAVSSNETIIPNAAIELKGDTENRYLKATSLTNQSGAVDVTVTVTDGYSEAQSIFQLYVLSNNANLIDLDTSGTTIPGFATDSLTYTCELSASITEAPVVTATAEHPEATINIFETDSLPGITTVEVIAEDGETTKTYLVTFIYSVNADNDASLTDIKIDGTTIDGFSPIKYHYTEYLPYGTTIVPAISATPKNELATVDINQTSELPGIDSILVTATDGVTEQLYIVEYIVESASDNNNLQKITIDGEELIEFNPELLEYTLEYPYGTNVVPMVMAIPEDANAFVDQTDATSMPGVTTIDVYAENGSLKTYLINFTLADPSNDATIEVLKVNGATIFGFEPNIYSYNVELDNSVLEVPAVIAEANHDSATVIITDAEDIPGTTTVVVTAQDGTTEITYEINFSYKPLSNISLLSDLKVSGTTINGFDPEIFNYTILLPEGTENVPGVTATVYDSKATKVIDNAEAIPGTTAVTVTAEDGSISTYSVNFTFENLNNDATLSDLAIDGSTITGFNPGTLVYSVELPYGTTDIPEVTATANDQNADVTITEATELPGTTSIVVTAEDQVTAQTYEVNFTIQAPASDASLGDLKVDGTTITGFDPETLVYSVELPYGTTNIPEVTATANDQNADVTITEATELPGTTSVVVTAEDQVTVQTYEVNFTIEAPASDASLSDLKVDGTTISEFGPGTFEYNIELPSGTTNVPTVTATENDANANISITDTESLPGTTSVLVTAEDGETTETYQVNFSVATYVTEINEDNSVKLYPNPTSGLINIMFKNPVNTKVKINIYNSIGAIVHTDEIQNTEEEKYEVDLSNLPKGMYFVKISTNDNTSVKNIILK